MRGAWSKNVNFFMRGKWSKRKVLVIKRKKMRFYTMMEQKPNIMQQQFSEVVTFFFEM